MTGIGSAFPKAVSGDAEEPGKPQVVRPAQETVANPANMPSRWTNAPFPDLSNPANTFTEPESTLRARGADPSDCGLDHSQVRVIGGATADMGGCDHGTEASEYGTDPSRARIAGGATADRGM